MIYSIDDLQAWVARAAMGSTSDVPKDAVLPAKPHAAAEPIRARLDAKAGRRK